MVVTLAGGAVARLVDRHDFHSLGTAVWWALQTVTTVGYGDIVPERTWARVVAAVVMVSGVAILAVVTASVTAALIESARAHRLTPRTPELTDEVSARLASIDSRLEELQAALRPAGQ